MYIHEVFWTCWECYQKQVIKFWWWSDLVSIVYHCLLKLGSYLVHFCASFIQMSSDFTGSDSQQLQFASVASWHRGLLHNVTNYVIRVKRQLRRAALTFAVQPFQLLLELFNEVADGGADGPQVEVSVDGDQRPIGRLGRGRQRRQVLQEDSRARWCKVRGN